MSASRTAADRTQAPASFGGPLGNSYEPACVLVSAGAVVRFRGNFSPHPLAGGEVVNGVGSVDPESAIPSVSAGTEAEVQLSSVGPQPFFCPNRVDRGMFGAIFVGEAFELHSALGFGMSSRLHNFVRGNPV